MKIVNNFIKIVLKIQRAWKKSLKMIQPRKILLSKHWDCVLKELIEK